MKIKERQTSKFLSMYVYQNRIQEYNQKYPNEILEIIQNRPKLFRSPWYGEEIRGRNLRFIITKSNEKKSNQISGYDPIIEIAILNYESHFKYNLLQPLELFNDKKSQIIKDLNEKLKDPFLAKYLKKLASDEAVYRLDQEFLEEHKAILEGNSILDITKGNLPWEKQHRIAQLREYRIWEAAQEFVIQQKQIIPWVCPVVYNVSIKDNYTNPKTGENTTALRINSEHEEQMALYHTGDGETLTLSFLVNREIKEIKIPIPKYQKL